MTTLENPSKKQKMVHILEGNNWSSSYSLNNVDRLDPERKNQLCTIVFDGINKQPEVFEVFVDVFKNKTEISCLDSIMTKKVMELVGALDFNIDFSDFMNEEELRRLEEVFKKTRPSELMY